MTLEQISKERKYIFMIQDWHVKPKNSLKIKAQQEMAVELIQRVVFPPDSLH